MTSAGGPVARATGLISLRKRPPSNRLAVGALILFFVLEYARPPLLAALRLQMVIALALPLLLLKQKRPWSGILTAQVLFWLVCVVEIAISSNNYAAYITARQMYGHLAMSLGISWLMVERLTFQRVVWAWLFTMSYVALYGIAHGGVGPGGMIGDENDLALGCVTALPFAFHGFERLAGRRRWVCGAIVGLLGTAVVVSFSRGGFLGLSAVGLSTLLTSRRRSRIVLILMVAVVLLVVLAPVGGRKGRSYFGELDTITETDKGSAKSRRYLWSTAVNMWLAHPILGVGGGNFPFQVGDYAPNDDPQYATDRNFSERNWSGTVTHSLYFQVLAEHGLVGIFLLGYIVVAHFRTLRRLLRDVRAKDAPADVRRDAEMYAAALRSGLVGFCVAGTFLSAAYYPYMWYLTAMSVALDVAVRRELGTNRPEA